MKTKPAPEKSAGGSAHLAALRARLKATRRKFITVLTTAGASRTVLILVSVLLVEGALDWLVELPWIARALILLATCGGAGWLLWRRTILPLRTRLDEDAVARMIERAMPIFESAFISSIQLGRLRESSSPSLVRALLAQTAALASRMSFQKVVPTRRMWRLLGAASGVSLAAAAALYFGGHASWQLLRRALLSTEQLPKRTQLTVLTGDRKIGVGEDLAIEVEAAGILPAGGRVVTTSASGRTQEFALTPDPKARSKYVARVQSPQENFEYRVYLNDAASRGYHVETLPRPAVAEVKARQIYPAYVGQPPEAREVTNLNLLLGSRLELEVRATTPVARASLRLAGKAGAVPLAVDRQDPHLLRGSLPIDDPALTGFSVDLVDAAGIESGRTAVYRIEVVADKKPSVKITQPARAEELATAKATVLVGFEATDDIGVASAALHYKLSGGAEKTIDFELGRARQPVVKRRFDWDLSALSPAPVPGAVIEFWIIAADANGGAAESEHYQVRIVTEDEKRADLANRLNDTMSGLSEITGSQEELNRKLGEAIFQKPK